MLEYTTIRHQFRKENKLSTLEYCVLDMVYFLSNNQSNSVGWCYMTRDSMAAELGISKQAVLNLIERLVSVGFLEKHNQTKHLRTTDKWYINYTLGKETLPLVNNVLGKETLPDTVKKVYQDGKETLPNNNIYNNIYNNSLTIDNNIILNEKKEKRKIVEKIEIAKVNNSPFGDGELHMTCIVYDQDNKNKYTPEEYKEFLGYWTAPVQKGSYKGKELWRSKETFSLAGRLSTWNSNNQKFNKNGNSGNSNSKQSKADYLTSTAKGLDEILRHKEQTGNYFDLAAV